VETFCFPSACCILNFILRSILFWILGLSRHLVQAVHGEEVAEALLIQIILQIVPVPGILHKQLILLSKRTKCLSQHLVRAQDIWALSLLLTKVVKIIVGENIPTLLATSEVGEIISKHGSWVCLFFLFWLFRRLLFLFFWFFGVHLFLEFGHRSRCLPFLSFL